MSVLAYYDNMFMELFQAAYKTASLLAQVKQGEAALVLADTAIDRRMLEYVAASAHLLGADAALMVYRVQGEVDQEPPRHVAAAMQSSDVIISFPLMYILHTKAYLEALRRGARILELTGMDPEMMIRLIGRTDYDGMVMLGDKLRDLTAKARHVVVESDKGTHLEFDNDPSRPVYHNDGILREKGFYKPLGGQISWAPVEDSINGVIVADGFIWPPDEIGVLESEVKLTIREGRITRIEGGREARILEKWLESLGDEKMYYVAHASWGFHPNARLRGIPLEDERVYGGVEFGFGSQSPKFKGKIGRAAAHTDISILGPRVYFDGELVAANGRFIHPELRELDRRLKG